MTSSASPKLFLFPWLLFTCLFFTFPKNLIANDSDKVNLNLYYESLCPYCQRFIVKGLVKVFKTDLYTITNLRFIPFGNAKLYENQTVSCQHGKEECELNAAAACAIRIWPNPRKHYKFIRCVERHVKVGNATNTWKSCAKRYEREALMNKCYFSDLSQKLILDYAKETLTLKPKHKFVPWLTVKGVPLYEKYEDFVGFLCKEYKGKSPLPKACNSSTLEKSNVLKNPQVSYALDAGSVPDQTG